MVQVNVNTIRKRNKNGVIENVFYDAGTYFVVSEVESKLRKVYNPDSVSLVLTESLESILTTYNDIVIVDSLNQNPDFIVETRLDKFVLSAGENGVYSNFSALTTIYDRKTAKKIWQRSESISQPLVEDYFYNPGYYNQSYFYNPGYYNQRPYNPFPKKGSTAYKKTNTFDYGRSISLFMLMSMSEEEIKSAIKYTTSLVAQNLANDLRDDLADAVE